MASKLINGKLLAERINKSTKRKVHKLKRLGVSVKLAVILVGDNPASEIYVKKKGEAAARLGVDFTLHRFEKTITAPKLLEELSDIQNDPTLSGLIVQLPLPKQLLTPQIINAVQPEYDVDCLSDVNFGKLILNTHLIEPPTAGAIMEILRSLKINLAGKHVCIVGTGALVGKPIAIMLMNKEATVTTCNSSTKKLADKCRTADIIITGVGKANLITSSMIKKGAIIIDAGVSFNKQGKAVGDVRVDDVLNKVRFVTPTPGGVGPMTVAVLLHNTVVLAEYKNSVQKK